MQTPQSGDHGLRNRVARAASWACFAAALLLVAMLFAPWPFEVPFPGIEILTGRQSITDAGLSRFLDALNVQYFVDTSFIVMWVIAWVTLCALCALVMPAVAVVARAALLLGMLGPLLDLGENGVILGLAAGLPSGTVADPAMIGLWRMIRLASYLIPYIATLLLICACWAGRLLSPGVALTSGLVTMLAVAGLFLPGIGWMSDLWWLLAFLAGGTFAARAGRKVES